MLHFPHSQQHFTNYLGLSSFHDSSIITMYSLLTIVISSQVTLPSPHCCRLFKCNLYSPHSHWLFTSYLTFSLHLPTLYVNLPSPHSCWVQKLPCTFLNLTLNLCSPTPTLLLPSWVFINYLVISSFDSSHVTLHSPHCCALLKTYFALTTFSLTRHK